MTRRILHLRTSCGKGGGPEKTLLNSPRFLVGRYDMQLAYIRPQHDPDFDMPARAAARGVTLVDIPERGRIDPRTIVRLSQTIRDFQPHLLHAHDYKTDVLAVLLGRWFRIPKITTLHGFVTRSPLLDLYYRIDFWALRRMEHCIAVSQDLYELLAEQRIPADRTSLILNAIDTDEYQRRLSIADAKRAIGAPPSGLLIGALGRLSAEKGFALLIEAVAELLRQGHDLHLWIAGEGSARAELERTISHWDVGQRVRLLGHLDQPQQFLQALDIFALSSLREGLPNALLEAMALEVPVMVTRIAGIPDLVCDGQEGVVVEPDSVPALRQGLTRLITDAELRTGTARRGRAKIEERHGFRQRMEKVAAVYDRVLDHSLPGENGHVPN